MDASDPIISVIIPAYNSEKFIETLINDLKNQVFTKFEVIIVDDGSTDETLSRTLVLTADDPRFCVVSQSNKGQARARLFGLCKAQAEFVTFLDADDKIGPQHLERLHDTQLKFDADLVMCNFYIVHQHSGHRRVRYPKGSEQESEIVPISTFLTKWISGDIDGYLVNKLFRRELFRQQLRIDNNNYMEDVRLVDQLIPVIRSVAYSAEPTYYYQIRENSATTRPTDGVKWNGLRYSIDSLMALVENQNHLELLQMRLVKTVIHLLVNTKGLSSGEVMEEMEKFGVFELLDGVTVYNRLNYLDRGVTRALQHHIIPHNIIQLRELMIKLRNILRSSRRENL